MVSSLKKIHPYLYKRVWLKGFLFVCLGLSQIFAQYIDQLVRASRNTPIGVSTIITGLIFVLIGGGILWGLYAKSTSYIVSRTFLKLAVVYALYWEFVLLTLAITRNVTTVSVVILWSYLTYNLWLIQRDSAWGGAEIVRDLRSGKS